jgi:hypothetical protein
MAYENYSFVSWTDGTPLSSDRLAQMSTNIEQVKTANDDKAIGVLALKNVTTSTANSNTYGSEVEIIGLKDESGSGGADNRVTIASNRYYKVVLNFPGIAIYGAGGEDGRFILRLYNGISGSSPTEIAEYQFSMPIHSFINTASAVANVANHTLKTAPRSTRVGAGKYEIVLTSDASGLTNQSFYCSLERAAGVSSNNPSSYQVVASVSNMQLYVEDAGGTV